MRGGGLGRRVERRACDCSAVGARPIGMQSGRALKTKKPSGLSSILMQWRQAGGIPLLGPSQVRVFTAELRRLTKLRKLQHN